jgi:hypothetical protein
VTPDHDAITFVRVHVYAPSAVCSWHGIRSALL